MAEKLNIQRISFKAGSVPGAPELDVLCPNVTVLVGPNNSGKSQTLRELEAWCQGKNPKLQVISSIELEWPDTYDDLASMLKPHHANPPPDQMAQAGHFWIGRPIIRQGEEELHQQVNEEQLRGWFENNNIALLQQIFVRTFTLRLDGRSRFDLVEPKATGPLEGHPKNHLWALFVNDEGREKVRQFTEAAFGKHYVIDPTGMTQFRVRLADRKPRSKSEEQGLDSRSRKFHKGAQLVSRLGDGVSTSVGLVSAIMSLPHRILLIDEPEAFLHPTLARRVGRVLSETAREREASLVVATHSAEFLMGCIQSAPDLRIIRLTYSDDIATARSIEPGDIIKLMNDPLLRSANALRALFHRGVVVTEADADRAFYEEINHRLMQSGKGIEDALFMNAQNWQTIPQIAAPLRRLGIAAAAIFDFDVLLDKDFSKIWPLLSASRQKLQALQAKRNRIKALLESKGRKTCKSRGVRAFRGKNRQLVDGFIDEMAKFGIFFVPLGELECWLATLAVAGGPKNKTKWLTNIFTAMGSDPTTRDYLLAGEKDVWAFIRQVESWIATPKRAGIPD